MKVCAILPTYNEKENIADLLKKLIETYSRMKGHAPHTFHIIVVDDNSPDGTAEIAKKFGGKGVETIVRKGKRGRGLAGIEGYKRAIEEKADYVIEMDADFSHDPSYIPEMLHEMGKDGTDIVLGSRLVKGSMDKRESPFRRFLTKASNFYVRSILGIGLRDCNSGYRCFRREALEKIIGSLKAEGPDIVQEVIYRAWQKGLRIREIPIRFMERKKGKSKLGFRQLVRGIAVVLRLRFA